MKSTKSTTCPITGDYKPRRYAVSAKAWKAASDKEKEVWASNANSGTLRRYSVHRLKVSR